MLLDIPQNGCEGDNGFIGVKVINYNLPIISTKITKKILKKSFFFSSKNCSYFLYRNNRILHASSQRVFAVVTHIIFFLRVDQELGCWVRVRDAHWNQSHLYLFT